MFWYKVQFLHELRKQLRFTIINFLLSPQVMLLDPSKHEFILFCH